MPAIVRSKNEIREEAGRLPSAGDMKNRQLDTPLLKKAYCESYDEDTESAIDGVR